MGYIILKVKNASTKYIEEGSMNDRPGMKPVTSNCSVSIYNYIYISLVERYKIPPKCLNCLIFLSPKLSEYIYQLIS